LTETSFVELAEEGLDRLFGTRDENLKRIERAFRVTVTARGNQLRISGEESQLSLAEAVLSQISELVVKGYPLQPVDVDTAIRVVQESPGTSLVEFFTGDGILGTARQLVSPRSLNQQLYLKAMSEFDLVIGIGPAGTGKTYLAVAMAAAALKDRLIRRIILARPAVEAGEKLGYLPGDLAEKVNPYLRPLYDALYDILGFDKVARLMERGTIEVAPIAFMRGRTLNDSFVILDEAQNTTSEQMKMFLTRIGFNSKAVVTGDITQVDLPAGKASGLIESQSVLRSIDGIKFIHFDERDVVRHRLVQQIVRAYERYQQEKDGGSGEPTPQEGRSRDGG
jgi:phosphate starvation-inducible PhoH-like protein